jgi:hypothetical protein
MQSYLFIGGANDGLSYPVEDDVDFVQWPGDATDSEVYARETLSVGDTRTAIFRHESLTPERVVFRLVHHYKAWCANKPGGPAVASDLNT